MNKQLFKEVGIKEEEFLDWCKQNQKPSYKRETKEEFFKLIRENKLIRNFDGKIVKND